MGKWLLDYEQRKQSVTTPGAVWVTLLLTAELGMVRTQITEQVSVFKTLLRSCSMHFAVTESLLNSLTRGK